MIQYKQSNRVAVQAALIGCILLVLLAVASLLVDTSHAHSWAEQNISFFWVYFSFGGAILIVALTRILGIIGLQQEKDPYSCPCCEPEEDKHD